MSTQFHTPDQETSSPLLHQQGGGPSRFRTWAVITGTAAVATLGLLMPSAASAAQIHHDPFPISVLSLPHGGRPTAPGGALLAGQLRLPTSDKATQVHMEFVNKTGQTLNLTDASHSGTGTAWQNRPPATLAPGATGNASVYSAGDAQIDLTYTGASDSTVFKLQGITPLLGDNSASGSSSSASYTVAATAGSGYNPTDNYTIEPGGTFNYTGQTVQYTVPVGVTQLKIEAIGGGTQSTGGVVNGTGGAEVTGTASVTPGETLTIGVASSGGVAGRYSGGWGMTYNGNNFSGGNTAEEGDMGYSKPGGGATVVAGSGGVIVVAGGGGGNGAPLAAGCYTTHQGGNGGEGGSWTGGNGNPFPGGGGQAGANTTSQGQASDSGNYCAGGAGGGGVQGGLAGVDGAGAGGGAGSSAASGLTNASITTDNVAPDTGSQQNGEVIIGAAS
jgi:hypothetical protein